MEEDKKEFFKRVNIDKAKKKVIIPIVAITISISTYFIGLIHDEFDFGIIFEVISLIFLIISRSYMTQYDEIRSKRYNICAMIPVGWLLIYDFMILCSSIRDGVDIVFFGYDYFFGEIFLILYMMMLFAINKDLSKADNPLKYKESTDWFYENAEDEKSRENEN